MNKKVGFYGGKFLPLHNGHIYSILYSARKCAASKLCSVDKLYIYILLLSVLLNSKDKYPKVSQYAKGSHTMTALNKHYLSMV